MRSKARCVKFLSKCLVDGKDRVRRRMIAARSGGYQGREHDGGRGGCGALSATASVYTKLNYILYTTSKV